MTIIRTEQLTRRYGSRRGVESLDLVVPEGCLFGFLGPNGAGKTTTIRVLLGFLRPTSGLATIFDRDCWRESSSIKAEVGYLPGDLRLYPWMNGRQALRIVGAARRRDLMRQGLELAERFELDLGVKVRQMSRGMRQKLGLVLALAHRPKLLVLDEPSSSLDPLMQEELRRQLQELAGQGNTIFFSSHSLHEIEQLCDRVAIVRDGRLVADETLESLRRRAGHEVCIRFLDSNSARTIQPPAFIHLLRRQNSQWEGLLDGSVEELIRWLALHPIADLTIGRPNLESLFRRYYQEQSPVMNRGVMIKAFCELWPTTLLLGMIALGVEAVLSYVLPTFQREFSTQILQLPFVRTVVQAMLGMDVAEGLGPQLFGAIAWVHPVVLATVWAHAIVCCTRVPAGEVDRGTIDLLLSLPVSRWELYCSETLVWLGSAVLLMGFAAAGNALGGSGVPAESRPDRLHVFIVLTNLLCLYLTVGAAACFFSALSDRRGRAIAIVFAFVLASFLLNYLAQFWGPARQTAFLGMLRYYRPLFILRDGIWPLRDMSVLLSVTLILWLAGGMTLARRDLATL